MPKNEVLGRSVGGADKMERDRKVIAQSSGRVFWKLCLFAILLFASCLMWKSQTQAKARSIKVGYIDYTRFIEEKNGNYSGYGVEYLEKISEYTGWRYEYVYDTWANCLEKLEKGEIDLLCTAQYTPERAGKFLYASIPLGYESMIVYVPADSDIYYNEYSAMDGSRVGLLEKSFQTSVFISHANKIDLHYEPVYFDTETQIMQALENKTIDMAAVGSLSNHTNVKAVGRYGAEAFYCITGKENRALMEDLDMALRQLKIDVPSLETELTQKYYGDSNYSSAPLFTRKEHDYIQQAEPVKVRIMDGIIPLSYIKDGKDAGMIVDYLNLISEKSGLKFDIEMIVTPDTMEEQMRLMQEEDYLMISAMRIVKYNGLEDTLICSKPMLETTLAYVRRQKDVLNRGQGAYVFALTEELKYLEEMLYTDSEYFRIKYYGSAEDCLNAVMEGDADVAVQDSYRVKYLMQKPMYRENLVEHSGNELKNGLCLMGSDENRQLIDIVDKTINYISNEEKTQIITTETLMNQYRYNAEDMLYEYRYAVLGVSICIILAAAFYTILLQRMMNLKIAKKEYEILQKKVQQDELTGVYNRRTFLEKARELIDNSEDSMCIVFMDISNFKVVNDLYGMENGDKLLQHMAQELQKKGSEDNFIVARFTGDHFYMCMRHEDFKKCHFQKRYKTFLEDMDIRVTYGVFVVGSQKDVPVNIMCDRASLAVHDKERTQREYIRYYSDEERERLLQVQEIENEMEKALEEHQFCVYVQPKYDVYSEKIVGGEALVRWKHPQKGMIPPGSFISIFEKNGFILRLDYYVWEETCRLLAELKKKGIRTYPVSINVSRAHLYGKELQDKLEELISKYQLAPEELELEITETTCAEDTDIIYKQIARLREAGFKVAMDDFGSGYSSLNMLKEIPLDIIKMDLKFLSGGDDIDKSYNILRTLITLAHNLNLLVVVEGVETEAQVQYLKSVDNHYVQGYYFSRPVDCETYEKMLKQEEE